MKVIERVLSDLEVKKWNEEVTGIERVYVCTCKTCGLKSKIALICVC